MQKRFENLRLIPGLAVVIFLIVIGSIFNLRNDLFNRYSGQVFTDDFRNTVMMVQEGISSREPLSNELARMVAALNYELVMSSHDDERSVFYELINPTSGRPLFIASTYERNQLNSETSLLEAELMQSMEVFLRSLTSLTNDFGISYAVVNEMNHEVLASNSGDLSRLLFSEFNMDDIWRLSSVYHDIVAFRFDEQGRSSVPFFLSPETEGIIWDFVNHRTESSKLAPNGHILGIHQGQFNLGLRQLESNEHFFWRNPESKTFIFAIPHWSIHRFVYEEEIEFTVEHDFYSDIWWDSFTSLRSIRNFAFWTMALIPLTFPVDKVKNRDKIYEKLKTFPLELIFFGTWLSWIFVHNDLSRLSRTIANWVMHNLRSLAFHSSSFDGINLFYQAFILFAALLLLGYSVMLLKEAYSEGSTFLKKQSFTYPYILEMVNLKLEKKLKINIAFIIVSQVIIILFLILIADFLTGDFLSGLFILLPVYLLLIYSVVTKYVDKNQQHYRALLTLAKELAAGKLETKTGEDFGMFDTLKIQMCEIQSGLKSAVQRRVSSEQMKSELITNVSHDLKTPLTAIISYVDLLTDDTLDEEKRKLYLNNLAAKSDRLKLLIEDLFEVSKANSGNLQLDLQSVDVTLLMKQTIAGLDDIIKDANLTIRETYPEDAVFLQLDGGRMHRVFENLIVNMVKYSLPATRGYIDIKQMDDLVCIVFKNISATELNIDAQGLLERFARGDDSRTTEGSGLGLAIAKSFVELHDGQLSIEIDGDLFKVTLTFNK